MGEETQDVACAGEKCTTGQAAEGGEEKIKLARVHDSSNGPTCPPIRIVTVRRRAERTNRGRLGAQIESTLHTLQPRGDTRHVGKDQRQGTGLRFLPTTTNRSNR
jgi:hypothetical protein